MDAQARVRQLGSILGVWAHPDDEIFTCGGILAIAKENGQQVYCMTATRGEAGVQDESRWPKSNLGSIRTKELEEAYGVIGSPGHCWFDLADGGLKDIDDNHGQKLVEQCLVQSQADCILTFGPDGLTGHPDHQAVSDWATEIGKKHNIPVYHAVLVPEIYEANKGADDKLDLFFNIDRPPIVNGEECDLLVKLDDYFLQKKCEALKVMESQTERLFKIVDGEELKNMERIESFVLAK